MIVAIGEHAHVAEALFPVEPRSDGDCVVERSNLRTILLRQREPAGLRQSVGLIHRVVLVEVLERKPIAMAQIVVDGTICLIGNQRRIPYQCYVGNSIRVCLLYTSRCV